MAPSPDPLFNQKRKRSDDAPVVMKKDEDGKTIYPRTEDGNTGSVWTLDDREEANLPMEFKAANDGDVAEEKKLDIADMLLAAGAATALTKRYGHQVPASLPPYVEAERSDDKTRYTFVPPPEARELGYREAIFLGEDDGKGFNTSVGSIMARGAALAAQVDEAIKRHDKEELERNDRHHNTKRVADNVRAGLAPEVALVAGAAAVNDDSAMIGIENAKMDEYNKLSSEALQRDLGQQSSPTDQVDQFREDDEEDERRLSPTSIVALTPEEAAHRRLEAKEKLPSIVPGSLPHPRPANDVELEPEPPAPK